jgi:hypothetical protein
VSSCFFVFCDSSCFSLDILCFALDILSIHVCACTYKSTHYTHAHTHTFSDYVSLSVVSLFPQASLVTGLSVDVMNRSGLDVMNMT